MQVIIRAYILIYWFWPPVEEIGYLDFYKK